MRRWFLLFLLLPSLSAHSSTRGARTPAPEPGGVYEPDPTSPQEVFDQMGHSFRADRARSQHLRFQFNFGEPQSGKWWIEVKDGAYTMGKGAIQRPDVTFTCSGADWVRLSVGSLSGFRAVMTGRLHVSGNHFAAHRLDEIFP